jgi:hypothetical protein
MTPILCAFCGREEPTFGVTGANYPMGSSCCARVLDRGITWDETTSYEEIRKALGIRAQKDNGEEAIA